MDISQKALGERLGLTARQIRNLDSERVFARTVTSGRATYPWPASRDAYINHKVMKELERLERAPALPEYEEARTRKVLAEAKLAEMAAAREEGRLVYAEHVDEVVGEIADRVRAVLINMPSNYIVHLERLGIAPEKGQAVLEEIAEALTLALRGEIEAMGEEEPAAA